METFHPTSSRPKSATRRRRLIVAALIAIAFLLALGVKRFLYRRIPSPDADAGRLSRYMASPAFTALPDAQKAPYLEAFRRASDRGELTLQQQRDVINNRGGRNPLQQYFSMPRGKEREKFLDDVIDRVLKEEKLHPPPDNQGTKGMRIDIGRLADTIPPEDRAQMNQFLHDLHNRRVARGVADDGKFLFNRAN